jgi:hypothetical protein
MERNQSVHVMLDQCKGVMLSPGFPEPVGTRPVRPVLGPTGPARFEKRQGTGL